MMTRRPRLARCWLALCAGRRDIRSRTPEARAQGLARAVGMEVEVKVKVEVEAVVVPVEVAAAARQPELALAQIASRMPSAG